MTIGTATDEAARNVEGERVAVEEDQAKKRKMHTGSVTRRV